MAVVPYKDTVKRYLNTPQKKAYTFLGFTLILVLVLLFGAIRPTVVTITKLRSEIKQRENINMQLQDKLNVLQNLQKDYNRLKDDIDKLNYYFPEDSDYSLLMANIEQIVKSYGFELERIQIESSEEFEDTPDNYDEMNLVEGRLAVVGKQEDLADMLEHLEGLPVFMEIGRISFAPEESDGIEQLNISISFTTYKKSAKSEEV